MGALLFTLSACNSAKTNENASAEPSTPESASVSTTPETSTSTTNLGINYTLEGTAINNYASLLVTKDKKKLNAGEPYLCMLTSNAARNNNEYLCLNFLLDTKPGTYPVVGSSLQRGNAPADESYGGILGGEPKLTDYKVTITECKDLGDNGKGGHKWSISGTCDLVVVKASAFMLADKSKNHPDEIKIENISFSNLTFDDNYDEILQKALK